MSNNWFKDMQKMHDKYNVKDWFNNELQKENFKKLKSYLSFRLLMCSEELDETLSAALVQNDPEEIVDGLIDLCVFAIGTLEVMGIDANKAWDQVLEANMNKNVGVKEGRPNPFGLPDLIKPKDWKSPNHVNNHGHLSEILKNS